MAQLPVAHDTSRSNSRKHVQDTLLAGRPFMRLKVVRMAQNLQPGEVQCSRSGVRLFFFDRTNLFATVCAHKGPSDLQCSKVG